MRQNWFSILVIFVLFGLLTLLAGLQYKWVGQISESERTRLSGRLQDDTRRFAEDFNREIQEVYYSFQLDSQNFENKDWGTFNKRFSFWKSQTKYPSVVQDIYFVKKDENELPLRFEKKKGSFEEAMWTGELREIADRIDRKREFNPIIEFEKHNKIINDKVVAPIESRLALAMPVFEHDGAVEEIIVKDQELHSQKLTKRTRFESTKRHGFLIILLDEKVIKERILPDLVGKYFSIGESGDYRLSIVNSKNYDLFQTHTEKIVSTDATTKLFSLNANSFAFFSEKVGNSIIDTQVRMTNDVDVHETIPDDLAAPKSDRIAVNADLERSPRIAVFEGKQRVADGAWTLSVQHMDGSLEQFITNRRRYNLGISFGILSLLAVSMGLILVAAQRAKAFAERQVNFVSSVTHEFRTPLSVIYSAGENLSDGVIVDKEKISSYGALLKREGRKLSGMVEQILEFAGAKSGNRKYDFRDIDIQNVVEEAFNECQPMIDEKGFEVVRDLADDLPNIFGDEKALTRAVQNLIYNSLKYSNGVRWIKVSSSNTDNGLRLTVEDKGIGIPSSDAKQIFEPFYRSRNVVDEQISGNGLGLSLVKQIVVAHGGSIGVESEVGKGTKFTIHLPFHH